MQNMECPQYLLPLSDRLFDERELYQLIEAFAIENRLLMTKEALAFAKDKHEGQVRKGKEQVPYIYHPLMVAMHAISLGLIEDEMIATALLHDVCEDCNVSVEELPGNEVVKTAVDYLTKHWEKGQSTPDKEEQYYRNISKNRIASIVKLLDRCHNISSMALGFTKERMIDYINETERYYVPLIEYIQKEYPEFVPALFLIRYQMRAVLDAVKRLL